MFERWYNGFHQIIINSHRKSWLLLNIQYLLSTDCKQPPMGASKHGQIWHTVLLTWLSCQVLDEAFNKIAESGDLTLERYKDLYAQFLGNPDESCLACNLFGPLPTLWTLLTPLLTKICNPLAQGFYQKYFQQRCLWFIVTWKTFFFAFYRKYKGSFNNDVIGFGWFKQIP